MRVCIDWRGGETGLDVSLRAWLWTLVLWLSLALLAAERPKAPTFLRAPGIVGEHFTINVELQIVPHPDIRAVVLEAWEAVQMFLDDDTDMPTLYQPGVLRSSDSQPVTELNQTQRTFPFVWREGLDAGIYILIAKTVTTRPYRTFETQRQLLVQ